MHKLRTYEWVNVIKLLNIIVKNSMINEPIAVYFLVYTPNGKSN